MVVAPVADHFINISATLVAGGVAALAWIRYRETALFDALFQASAFAVLFTGGAISVVLSLTGLDTATGFARSAPGQAPLYLWTIQRFLGGVLLFAGAYVALAGRSAPRHRAAVLIAIGPAAAVAIVDVAILVADDWLPVLVSPETLAVLTTRLEYFNASLVSLPMVMLQVGIGLLFVLASMGYARLYSRRQESRPYSAYLAVALLIGAFSQLHFAIVPGAYSELVATGDVLRLVFYVVVAVGVGAAARRDLRDLHRTNSTLQELRQSDGRRIQLEERARLARDMHDGLVQELWLARLTHGQLAQVDGMPAKAHEIAGRLDSILENALAEARQAVVAMQPREDETFGGLLLRFVEDYGDRFGLEVQCVLDGPPIRLEAHVQTEVLRVCREALNNARKHADAGLVRVVLESRSDGLSLVVSDNGAGFDPSVARRSGYGMRGMHERATALGGALEVTSAPMDGTTVTLTVPQGPSAP